MIIWKAKFNYGAAETNGLIGRSVSKGLHFMGDAKVDLLCSWLIKPGTSERL